MTPCCQSGNFIEHKCCLSCLFLEISQHVVTSVISKSMWSILQVTAVIPGCCSLPGLQKNQLWNSQGSWEILWIFFFFFLVENLLAIFFAQFCQKWLLQRFLQNYIFGYKDTSLFVLAWCNYMLEDVFTPFQLSCQVATINAVYYHGLLYTLGFLMLFVH